jgi:hypothetical protein
VLVALAALAGGGLAVLLVLFLTRDEPGEQSVDEAVEEFRGEEGEDGGDSLDRPAAGVYAAEGEGEAALSPLGISQQDGPDVPITVRHEPEGCWSLEISLNEDHRQINHLCPDADGRLVEAHSETEQRWDLGAMSLDNVTEFVCDPPAVVVDPSAQPGDAWEQRCEGTSTGVSGATTSAGPYRFEGEEDLEVADVTVTTRRYRQERTITGSQDGTQVVHHWYDAASGLLVREERSSEVGSDSPVGTITYTEEGWWQLTSLEPRT